MGAQRVDIFTAAMRAEFLNTYASVAKTPPLWEKVVQVVPSTTKIENYAHMSPAPGMSEFTGRRRFAQIGEMSYKIENRVYDGGFSAKLDDIEDDQVGGYKLKAQELGMKVKAFPAKAAFLKLRAGSSTLCFDGSNFFGDTHIIGTGDNTISEDYAGNDGLTHYLYACYVGGPIKPLFWQERQKADLYTDAGSPASQMARQVNYWGDLRGAAGYGYWWDCIQVTMTDTPTVAELQTTLGKVSARFRGFKLATGSTEEQPEYVHEQSEFNASTMHICCSTGIEHIVRQCMSMDYVNNASNPYMGFATFQASGILDSVGA